MQLIDHAGHIWHKLLSVRLSLLAGFASAADAGWEAHVSGSPRWISVATAAISFGAAIARMIAQPKLRRG